MKDIRLFLDGWLSENSINGDDIEQVLADLGKGLSV
jgi:hypothetical protein